jgi:hypothetical protein
MPQRADEYRRLAIRARQEAAETTKPDLQKTFETIAHNWEALAEQADWLDDKYASLVPLAPSAESRPMQQQQQQQIQATAHDKKQE